MEQGLGFVGPSVRLISYSKWSGNTFSGFPGTETNIIIQYFHCSGWMEMEKWKIWFSWKSQSVEILW